MPARETTLAEFKVGTYICPKTKSTLPLKATRPLPFLEWPIVVERCADCGEKHVLECEDVQHPPAFGYE
jgi:hypothetical protein